jgi:hypothetical protein
MPHTDFSVDGAFMRMEGLFGDQKELHRGRDLDLFKYCLSFPVGEKH